MCPEYLVDLSFYCTPGEPGKCYQEHSDPISECGSNEVGRAELRLMVLCEKPGCCAFIRSILFPMAQHESCDYDSLYSVNSRLHPMFL